jgi:hypothetical protein
MSFDLKHSFHHITPSDSYLSAEVSMNVVKTNMLYILGGYDPDIRVASAKE